MPITKLLVIAAGIVLLATSCNRDDVKYASTAKGLAQAAKDASGLEFNGEFKQLYELTTDKCQDGVTLSVFKAQFVATRATLQTELKIDASDLHVKFVRTKNVTKTKGEANVFVADSSGELLEDVNTEDAYVTWVYKDGTWRSTDCFGVASDSGRTDDQFEGLTGGSAARLQSVDNN